MQQTAQQPDFVREQSRGMPHMRKPVSGHFEIYPRVPLVDDGTQKSESMEQTAEKQGHKERRVSQMKNPFFMES